MRVTILRIERGIREIVGVFLVEGELFSYCLELPWMHNTRDVSCIPEGFYECKREVGPKFGKTWRVKNVPGRGAILLGGHAGNTALDTDGCILLGKYPGEIGGFRAVMSSGQVTAAFEARTADVDTLSLGIWSVYP